MGIIFKKKNVHFLHIGKTGGTAVKSVLEDYLETSRYSLTLHDHSVSIKDIPKGELVVFFLRDPVKRFISAFYSRKRKGFPRYCSEWSPIEERIFNRFSTPGQIAAALANNHSKDHDLAVMAMKNIQHFLPYKNWYCDFDYFESRAEDVLFIGFQESLDIDFIALKKIFDISPSALLPTDAVLAHRNPDFLDKMIDEFGVMALKKWYSDDFIFISKCKELMSCNQYVKQKNVGYSATNLVQQLWRNLTIN